ncbi:MAG: ImmA/IrrE family metallo-endopeptidase [Treponema sp.]|nr:ImmA/IrrE family metallo-endopeptidase [Treponema sp.]
MPTVKVNISPSVLDWILKTALLEGLDDDVITHLYKWKNNEKQPTFNKIEEYSRKISIPLGYFFLDTPPLEQYPLLKFRTINSTSNTNPSRDLIDTYYHMTAIQDWMREYLIDSGNEKINLIGSLKNERKVNKITSVIKDAINLEDDWYTKSKTPHDSFNILRQCFEKIGILVMKNGIVGLNTHRPLDIHEFRAFTLLDDYAPLVFINNKDTDGGQLFSLLHEIVHIWLGSNSFYNDSHGMSFNISPLEIVCNAVAADLLVPERIFIEKWNDNNNLPIEENINKLVKQFRCGKSVIIRKALDNNFITNEQYNEFTNYIIAVSRLKKSNNNGGGDHYKNLESRYSPRFILALANSINEGRTLYKEANKLICSNRVIFDRFVNEVKVHSNVQ